MKEELQKTLIEKYPTLFKAKNDPYSSMQFGLEVGDGWYNLLDTTFSALTNLYKTSCTVENVDIIKKLELKPFQQGDSQVYPFLFDPPLVILDQVKEKFGGLRIYHHLEFDADFASIAFGAEPEEDARDSAVRYQAYVDGIVSLAETISYKTCECTGLPGRLHKAGGWYRTLNEDYVKNELKERNYQPCEDL